jgi:hypothetical protein
MSSEFQLLLQQAKQQVKKKPEISLEPERKDLKDFQKTAQALPSEIRIAPKKVIPKPETKTESVKKKSTSFNKLMKLAKTVKPEGLIRDVSKIRPTSNGSTTSRPTSNGTSTTTSRTIPSSTHRPLATSISSRPTNRPSPPKPLSHAPLKKQSSQVRIDGNGKLNSKSGVKADLIKLNVKKRDLATIEEIEEERRLKKLKSSGMDEARVGRVEKRVEPRLESKSVNRSESRSEPIRKRLEQRMDRKRPEPRPETTRQREPSNNYSSIISQMFGYDRSRYRDDSSDEDMEVGFGALEKEEKRSTKIAKKEDLEEEKRELERERKRAR